MCRTAQRASFATFATPFILSAAIRILGDTHSFRVPIGREDATTRQRTIPPGVMLASDVVADRDELEVQPVLVAGVSGERGR
jgi:hypothetical protein